MKSPPPARISWNLEVHYCSHKRSIQSMPPHPTSWISILILSSYPRLGLVSSLFPLGFPIKTLYARLLYPVSVICSTHLILLHLIIRIIFGKEYRSLRSSLCSFLHSPVTSSLLGPNILLSTLFSNTQPALLSQFERTSFTPIYNMQNYCSVYLNLYIFGSQTGRQKILHWIIANIPWFQSALNLLVNRIFIC